MPKGAKKKVTKLVYVVVQPDGSEQVVDTDLEEIKPGKFRVIRRVVRTVVIKDGKRQVADEKVEEPHDDKPSALDKIISGVTIAFAPKQAQPGEERPDLRPPTAEFIQVEKSFWDERPDPKISVAVAVPASPEPEKDKKHKDKKEKKEKTPEPQTPDTKSKKEKKPKDKAPVEEVKSKAPKAEASPKGGSLERQAQPVGENIIKVKIVRKVIHADGKETVTEEKREEPMPAELVDPAKPRVIKRTIYIVVRPDGQEEVTQEDVDDHPEGAKTSIFSRLRKIIRKVIGPDGKEHITEEDVHFPELYVSQDQLRKRPDEWVRRVKLIRRVQRPDGSEQTTEEDVEEPEEAMPKGAKKKVTKLVYVVVQPDGSEQVVDTDLEETKPGKFRVIRRVVRTIVIKDGKRQVADEKVEEPQDDKPSALDSIVSIAASCCPSESPAAGPSVASSLHPVEVDASHYSVEAPVSSKTVSDLPSPSPQTKVVMRKIRVITKRVGADGSVQETYEDREEPEVLTLEEFSQDHIRRARKVITILIHRDGGEDVTEELIDDSDQSDSKPSAFGRLIKKTKKILTKALSPEGEGSPQPDSACQVVQPQQVKIIRRIVRRVVIINGEEHEVEEIVDEPLEESDTEKCLVLSHLVSPKPHHKVIGEDGTNLNVLAGDHFGSTVSYVIVEETVPSVTTGRVFKTRKVIKKVTSPEGQEVVEEQNDEPLDVTDHAKSLLWVRKTTYITIDPDGRQHVTEEVEEPAIGDEASKVIATTVTTTRKTIQKVVSPDGKEHIYEKTVEVPEVGTVSATLLTPLTVSSLRSIEASGPSVEDVSKSSFDFISNERLSHKDATPTPQSRKSLKSKSESPTLVTRVVKIIRKVIGSNGKETTTEELHEEPVEVPKGENEAKYRRSRVVTIVVDPNGKEHVTELFIDEPQTPSPIGNVSIATSPMSPGLLEMEAGGTQTYNVSLQLQGKAGVKGPTPQVQSTVVVEKSGSHPTLELTKQWSTVDIPSPEVHETLIPAEEIKSMEDDLSVSSSLVESTDIFMPEDTVSSTDSPLPSEDLLRKDLHTPLSELDSGTKTFEHGYEPEDATTMDEFSLSEDFTRRGRKKTKKRQKLPVNWSDTETNLPKSSPATPSAATTVSEVDPTTEIQTAIIASVDSARSSAHTIPSSSPDEMVRIVEESVISSPSSPEARAGISSQLAKSIPVLERVPTQEGGAQTTTPMPQQISTEDLSVQTVVEPTMEESVQTSPHQQELTQSPTRKDPGLEEASQTSSPERPKLLSSQSQTISMETKDDGMQTISPVPEPEKSTAEFSVQTETTKHSESSMQTSKPSSPKQVSVQSGEAGVQTPVPETDSQSVQTLAPMPSAESSVQTFSSTKEMAQQTTSPMQSVPREVATTVAAMQTSPLPIASDDDQTSSCSSDQPIEVTIKTSVTVLPGSDNVSVTNVTLGKEEIKNIKSKARRGSQDKPKPTATHADASIHRNIELEPGSNIMTNVDVVLEPDVKTLTQNFIQGERPKEQPIEAAQPSKGPFSENRLNKTLRRVNRGSSYPSRRSNVLYLASVQGDQPLDPTEEEERVKQLLRILPKAKNEDKEESTVSILESIANWLQTIEYRILVLRETHSKEGPSTDRVKELGDLEEMAQRATKAIKDLDSLMGSQNQLSPYVKSLAEQGSDISELAKDAKKQQEDDLNKWNAFTQEVDVVHDLVLGTREQLGAIAASDGPARELLAHIDQIDVENSNHAVRVSQLLKMAHGLLRDFPGHDLPPEIYPLQDLIRQNRQDIAENKERVEQRIALAGEYVATLGELEQITDVAEALVSSPIAVKDLQNLQDEMQKHRKFFVNLSHCRGLLESLEGSLDPETRTAHSALHGRLHARASAILDAASSRSQEMALAASRWTLLDAGVREEKKWLQVARERQPDLGSVTCNDFDQYISLYQSLQSDVALHHARIQHLTNTAHLLQAMVSCAGLEETYDEYLETVLRLRDDVNDSVHRLVAFRESWRAYEVLMDRLGCWLSEAEQELDDMEKKTPTENMRRFWELKAQVEMHSQVRAEASAHLEAALRVIPVSDEMQRRAAHSAVDERWRRVVGRADAMQESLTSELKAQDVPVANKLKLLERELSELGAALDDMHGVIKTQEELSLYVERLQVMRHRAIHIQEDLSRLGLLPTAESDQVGALLGVARSLETTLSEEAEDAARLLEKLQALERGLAAVARDHRRDEDALRCCEASEGEDSQGVERAVLECEAVGRDLQDQWQELMALRQLLHSLPTGLRVSVSPSHLERRISASQDAHAGLEAKCQALLGLLATRLQLWKTFEERLEAVQSTVQEADYMVELLSVGTSLDLDRLVTATERLEAVRSSLSERGDLVGSLAAAAEPLRAVCCPEVAARVDAAVREAGEAWDGAQEQVELLTERYERVVDLWRRYRDAADQLRDFTDHLQLPPANLPPEELARAVQVTEEAVAAKQKRLEELRALAAEITESLGVGVAGQAANGGPGAGMPSTGGGAGAGAGGALLPLDAELAALDRRLAAVRDSISSLDKVADGRQKAEKQLSDTKAFLGSVRKEVSKPQRASESDAEAGERLVALREHLLQLGATEGQLQALRDKSAELTDHTPPATPDPARETSVVEILELWQQVFRDTFQQYRSLSARLVRSEDGVTALRLWQEYLLNLQAFLSAGLPGDYDALTQHEHQCEVHENLLTSQASVLLGGTGLERGDPAVARQLQELNTLHNATLARITERHAAVRARLDLWAAYRAAQAALLHWLQAMERERGRLQLRYISLRRLPQLAQRIGELLAKVPAGEQQAGELAALQGRLLAGCDEALATSVRMEHAAVAQRISNLRAGLETWRDFLVKLEVLAQEFDAGAAAADGELSDVARALDALEAPRAGAGDAATAAVRGLQQRLDDAVADLERLGVSEEKLKEAVSPTDLKATAQRVRLLWQKHADVEHRLRTRALALQEADSERQRYVQRADRFLRWAGEQAARLERLERGQPGGGGQLEPDLDMAAADPAEALRRLEASVSAEVELKRREADWLLQAPPAKDTAGARQQDPQALEARARVRDAWERVQALLRARSEKLQRVVETAAQLQRRLEELRARLYALEKELKRPLELDAPTQKAVNKRLKEHEDLQRRIEHEAKEFGDVNRLCDVVRGDCDPAAAASVVRGMESVEARWKSVCALSAERKRTIKDLWKLLQELIELCANQRKWLTGAERTVREVREAADGAVARRDLGRLVQRLDALLREVESRRNSLGVVETSYGRLSRELTNCPSLLGESRALAERWAAVGPQALELRQFLLTLAASHDKFEAAHREAVLALTQLDARLSQLQLQEPAARDPRQLQALTQDLESRSALLTTADQLGLELMRAAPQDEVERLQTLVDEYQGLWRDIGQRLDQLTQQQVDQGVQVTTLRFETEAAVQVDTLPKRLTARDGYLHELQAGLRELRVTTDRLEDLLVQGQGQGGQPGDASSLASSRALGKATAACEASHELVRHLHALLVQQCGMTPAEAMADEVAALEERFLALRERARLREREIRDLSGKLTCPLCSRRNWQQLDNDLWRLEKWLEHAEAEQSLQTNPPSSIEQLEDIIQDQREFLLNLDSHRSIVKSLNIVGVHLADHTDDEDRARELRARLASANTRWEAVCRAAGVWQTRLQTALMENDEFHQILEEQTRWLITTEENIQSTEPVDVTEDLVVIEAKYLKFRDLHAELERYEPRVMSLQEAADSLLRHTDAPVGAGSTLQRLTDLRLRLQSLRRLTALYCVKLGAVLGRSPDELDGSARAASLASLSSELLDQASGGQLQASSHSIQANADSGLGGDAVDTRVLTRGYRFLGRVLRASLPIQALMLLLLGVASLMPADQDYSCVLSNNFARSFEPMLRYPNGPPPI